MNSNTAVDRQGKLRLRVVSTKYPMERIKLLEAIQERRGDEFISRTVAHALDKLIEEYLPGSIGEAA